eukprot:6200918-Pyramimonas_sp.AAC.1
MYIQCGLCRGSFGCQRGDVRADLLLRRPPARSSANDTIPAHSLSYDVEHATLWRGVFGGIARRIHADICGHVATSWTIGTFVKRLAYLLLSRLAFTVAECIFDATEITHVQGAGRDRL